MPLLKPLGVLCICGILVAVGFCGFETRIGRFRTDAMQCQLLSLHFCGECVSVGLAI